MQMPAVERLRHLQQQASNLLSLHKKINYFTFSTAGQYTIGVRTRDIAYDSTRHQSLDSCWRNGGGDRGGCKRGVDSASVTVTVK